MHISETSIKLAMKLYPDLKTVDRARAFVYKIKKEKMSIDRQMGKRVPALRNKETFED